MSYQQCDPLLRFLQNVGYHLIGEDRSSRSQGAKAASESNGLTPATRAKPTQNPQSREVSPSQKLHHRFSHVVPDPLHAQRLWKVPEARETTKRASPPGDTIQAGAVPAHTNADLPDCSATERRWWQNPSSLTPQHQLP